MTIQFNFLKPKLGFLKTRSSKGKITTAWRLFLSIVQMTYFLFATLITSRCIIYLIDLAWFGYGVANVISNRKIPASEMVRDEDITTFGQLLPTLLLSSIVLVFKEAYQEQKTQTRNEGLSRPPISQIHLLQSSQASAAATTPSSQIFEMRRMEGSEDITTPTASSPQQMDIEMGGGSQASGVEGRPRRSEPKNGLMSLPRRDQASPH
ncbi:hypothetical protein ABVK25_011664 [Lepraria finkii]|uniref:Uncharacterized protein n=1 Tax=Lepraria finkii TaxID=1340010 RepID=A0ABR4ALK9_9LECA